MVDAESPDPWREGRQTVASDQIGSIVGVIFGCAWAIAAATSLPKKAALGVLATSVAIGLLLIVGVLRSPVHAERSFDGVIYGASVAAEVALIIVCAAYLSRTGKNSLIPPVITFIAGLHFIGMWIASGHPVFLGIAGGLCIVGIVASCLKSGLRLTAAGLGSAVVLWIGVASTLV